MDIVYSYDCLCLFFSEIVYSRKGRATRVQKHHWYIKINHFVGHNLLKVSDWNNFWKVTDYWLSFYCVSTFYILALKGHFCLITGNHTNIESLSSKILAHFKADSIWTASHKSPSFTLDSTILAHESIRAALRQRSYHMSIEEPKNTEYYLSQL